MLHWSKIPQKKLPLPLPFTLHLKTPTLCIESIACRKQASTDVFPFKSVGLAKGPLQYLGYGPNTDSKKTGISLSEIKARSVKSQFTDANIMEVQIKARL